MDFVIGGLAAMGATIFSNPLDVIKTRMQLQGELRAPGQHAIHYRHSLHALYIIVKEEGIFALQKGLPAALIMNGVRSSIKLGSYEWFGHNGYICDSNGKTIFHKSLLAGSFSGAAGAFFGNPLFLINTQMQAQAAKKIAVGHQHGHAGVVQALKNVYNKHGIQGLWRGSSANILATLVGTSVQLTTFSKTKDALRNYEMFRHSTILTAFAASILGGIIQSMFQTPLDLISIRLYNQNIDKSGKGMLYKGISDCFVKIWQSEGFFGLYKGLGINYRRIARHTSLSLILWDVLKEKQKQQPRKCQPFEDNFK